MIEQDTVKLLRECDAGIKMGLASIDDVIDHVHNRDFYEKLSYHKSEYSHLQNEIQSLLDVYHDDGKDPNIIAKGMAWAKTGMKLGMEESDKTIADLLTDGCNMGVKSLNRYLNQYKAADEASKDITKRIISLSEHQLEDIKQYL